MAALVAPIHIAVSRPVRALPARPEMELQIVFAEEINALQRVVQMQGFDATISDRRYVYLILHWTGGRLRRKYSLSLIFDGERNGLPRILAEYNTRAMCVGRGSVSVGTDELISETFSRRFFSLVDDVPSTVQTMRRGIPFGVPAIRPREWFGPFSKRQQMYAARLIEVPTITLYGFWARWASKEGFTEERFFLLLAAAPEEAVALLHGHFNERYPEVDISHISLEMDDMRLETVVSGFNLFITSRTSRLDELAFARAFNFEPIMREDD